MEAAAAAGEGEVWAQGGAHAAEGGDEDGEDEFARLRRADRSAVRSDVETAGADETDFTRWRRHEEREGFLARLQKAHHVRCKAPPLAINPAHARTRGRQFSYFAMDGKTGAVRWRHESGDFQEAVPGESQV